MVRSFWLTVAYVDPGSGAMLLQWLLAGCLGLALYFRAAAARALRRVLSRKGKKTHGDGEQRS